MSNGRCWAMMKPSLLFGNDLSLQPSERKLLFESAQLPTQCWLEQLSCGTNLERFSEEPSMPQRDATFDENVGAARRPLSPSGDWLFHPRT